MTAIPNSFSMDDLEKMLENAQAETEVDTTEDFSEETILSLCDAITDLMQEKSNGPLLPKCVAVTVLNHLIQWHTKMGADRMNEGDDSGVAWLRDAGKLQAAAMALMSVDLGEDDFMSRRK